MSLNEPPSALERVEALERLPGLRSRAARRRKWRAAALAGAVMMVVAAGVVPASLLAFRGSSPGTQVQVGSNPGSTTTPSTRSPTTSPASSVPSTTAPPSTSPPATSASGPAGGPVPPGFAAASVTFVSDSEGFVLGTAPCASPPCTSVLRTTDGGATWVGVPAPRAPLAGAGTTQGAVSELRFADPSDGFAFGPGLWTTHDGGAHWSELGSVAGISPYDVSDLVATSSGVYALVQGWDPAQGGGNGHFLLVRGSASGDSFSVIDDFGPNLSVNNLVASGGAVYALAQTGTPSLSLVRATGSTVATTPVTPPDLPSQAGGCFGPLAASSASDLLLECGGAVADGAMGDRLLYGSTDSGQSWTPLPDPGMGAGYDTWGVADGGGGHTVIATSSGVISGLLATTDYAQSWSLVLEIPSQGAGWGDLGFEDATHGVVIFDPGGPLNAATAGSAPAGSGILYRTTDGGTSWAAVTF